MTAVAEDFRTIIRRGILLDPRTCMFQPPELRDTRTRLSPGVQNCTISNDLNDNCISDLYNCILAWIFQLGFSNQYKLQCSLIFIVFFNNIIIVCLSSYLLYIIICKNSK